MNGTNLCCICGKSIEETMTFCEDCYLEMDIRELESQVEM